MTAVMGLDVGGTNIKVARIRVVDSNIAVGATSTHPTPAGGAPEAVLASLVEFTLESDADAVGVAIPGRFDSATGEILSLPNLEGSWPGFGLSDALEAEIGVPVTLVNDAQAFTLAEARLGIARGFRDVVGVAFGTGIGGGIIIDGALRPGAHGGAGEIGHQLVPGAPAVACGCGGSGCLETLAKASVLARLGGRSSAEAVFSAAASGDHRAADAISTVADFIGMGLANVITILDPQIIVLGGGVAEAGDAFLGPIRAATARHVSVVPSTEIEIVKGSLGPTAGAVGAALAAAERLQ